MFNKIIWKIELADNKWNCVVRIQLSFVTINNLLGASSHVEVECSDDSTQLDMHKFSPAETTT